jgi:hypothetical protein
VFAFELDGVNLLVGANEEPLVRVVGALVEATTGLLVDGERAGQISLEDVHLELCLWRTEGHGLEATVVNLSLPPRVAQGVVRLELPEFLEAVGRCARGLVGDLSERGAELTAERELLERQLRRLHGAVLSELEPRAPPPFAIRREAAEGLGFTVRDDEGRLLAWSRRSRAALPPLLVGGEVSLRTGQAERGHPFLTMMGLARAAGGGEVTFLRTPLPPEEIFRAGLDLCLALRSHHPALGSNPYVEALQRRCTDGLTALRQPVPETTGPRVSSPRPPAEAPLAPVGQLRRVRLKPGWSRTVALGEEGGRLLLGRKWIIAHSPRAAHAFTRRGQEGFRHLSSRGVAIADDGFAILASPEVVLGQQALSRSAAWLRDHDGLAIGPTATRLGDVLVTRLGRRGAVAFQTVTGRELWRFEPARTHGSSLAVVGERVLVGTDGGTLYGLDGRTGQPRFQINTNLPVAHAPLAVRHRAVVVLNRGDHCAVFVCNAHGETGSVPAGAIGWTRELVLSTPCPPAALRTRLFVGGGRDNRAVVVSLGHRGQVLWERDVPCDARTLRLLPAEGGVIATDARGAGARLEADGATAWVLGSVGDELQHPIRPALRRQVLVLPGPVTRLVQPRGGRVLAELETSGHLLDVAVDARLSLYVLREPGVLEHWAPSAALAVL